MFFNNVLLTGNTFTLLRNLHIQVLFFPRSV